MFQNPPKRMALNDVPFRIGPPVEVSLQPAGPHAGGRKQKVKTG